MPPAEPLALASTVPSMSSRLRLGSVNDGAVVWRFARRASIRPSRLLGVLAMLSLVSVGIAGGLWWWWGTAWFMPFAGLEVLGMGAAYVVCRRHAGDHERVEWRDGRILVDCSSGGRVDRVELGPGWIDVRLTPGDHAMGSGPLLCLSSRGRQVRVGRHLRPAMRPEWVAELREVLRSG